MTSSLGKENYRTQAYEYIRERMILGELKPGDQLSPPQIAEILKISRTPVREAINLLEQEQLVSQIPRHGAFVRRPKKSELLDHLELRALNECYATSRAIKRHSKQDLVKLQASVDEMYEIALVRRQENLPSRELCQRSYLSDVKFHETIWNASGNKFLTESVFNMASSNAFLGLVGIPSIQSYSLKMLSRNWYEHNKIFNAIKDRDAELAMSCLCRHLLHIYNSINNINEPDFEEVETLSKNGFKEIFEIFAKKTQ